MGLQRCLLRARRLRLGQLSASQRDVTMASNAADARRDVRYEPDERPPLLVSCGLGLQYAMLAVPTPVLSAAPAGATYSG